MKYMRKKINIILILFTCAIFIGSCSNQIKDEMNENSFELKTSFDRNIAENVNFTEADGTWIIDSKEFSNNNIIYKYTEGEEFEFYVISAWIKIGNYKSKLPENGSIMIYVDDESDFNRKFVKSESVNLSNNQTKDGWTCIKRVVKLNDCGAIQFGISVGTQDNEFSGNVKIEQVAITPVKYDSDFKIVSSADETVRMIFRNSDILESGISNDKLHSWLDCYSKIRKSLKWLVGNKEPYNGVTDFIITESFDYYGLAGNPIYINRDYVVEDLKAIEIDTTSESNNIIWGYIHEMSHTFDGVDSDIYKANWLFDAEFFATFKCACALAINNYGMGNDHYLANDIGMHFANSAKLSNGVYSDEGFIYRLLTIMNNTSIAWEDLRDTFLDFDNVTSTNKLEKFQMFIDILSKNSGVDIKTQFTEKEWETLISKYKNNN